MHEGAQARAAAMRDEVNKEQGRGDAQGRWQG